MSGASVMMHAIICSIRVRRLVVTHNLKFCLRATALLSCLFMLSTSFYAFGSTDKIPIFSSGTIIYSQSATLLFKSSFEFPVDFTSLKKLALTGADQGFDWANAPHWMSYHTEEVGTIVDTYFAGEGQVITLTDPSGNQWYITSPRPHSGTRSFFQAQIIRKIFSGPEAGNPIRNELNYDTDDSVDGTKVFIRRWLYYPSDFSLPLPSGYMAGVASHRQGQFSVGVGITAEGGNLHWFAEAMDYDTQTRPWRSESAHEVPISRWFKLEDYIERDYYNGVYKVWVDGTLIINMEGVQTLKTPTSYGVVSHRVGKIYPGKEDWGYNYPYYHWLDDIEIWATIPQ